MKTVKTTVEIIDAIQELDGGRVTQLAEYMDLSPSTIQGYLNTLMVEGYLVKEGDVYHLGLRFLNKGGYVRTRKRLFEIVIQKLEEIAKDTDERVQFIVQQGGHGYYIHTVTGSQAVQMNARIGKQTHLHASAAGKSILAHLSEDYVNHLIESQGLPQLTNNTITDETELRTELEEIRDQGISFNMEESIEGLRAVGVPIFDSNKNPLGGLSISGPTNRMGGTLLEEELPNLLLGAANEIELKIAYNE